MRPLVNRENFNLRIGSAGNSIMASEVNMDSAETVQVKTNSTTFKKQTVFKSCSLGCLNSNVHDWMKSFHKIMIDRLDRVIHTLN